MELFLYIFAAIAAVALIYFTVNISHYGYNKKHAGREMILCQNGDAGKLRYGCFRSSYNGCGWIAVHNALKLLGEEPRTEKIISELEWTGALLFGVFGTWPYAVAGYFRRRGYKVTVTYDEKKYDRTAEKNKVSIVWFFHKKGAHFVTLVRRGDDYVGYNTYSDSKSADNWGPSISENLRKRGKHPVMLISVS